MAKKSDFTAEEWEVLRDAPHFVSLAVATAGASGPFGSLKEAFAPAKAIVEAAQGGNELLRAICAQQSVRGSIKAKDMKSLREELQTLAADKARAATSILQDKSPGDADAYRTFLVGIAERTAQAAKEGGFLGFGGEWVSKDERTVLNRISEAVEV
jgi:hypothetical protein